MTDQVTFHGGAAVRPLFVLGDEVRVLARLEPSALWLAAVTAAPDGGPPLHAHPSPETIHVLEGELDLWHGRPVAPVRTLMRPGDTVAIPAGAAHAYHNSRAVPARFLAIFDSSLLAFLEAATRPAPSGPPSPVEIARVLALAARHGMTILAPPQPT